METGPQHIRVRGKGRGFASLSLERRRELASKGGKTAQARGHAHKWTAEEARQAGARGGTARHRKEKA